MLLAIADVLDAAQVAGARQALAGAEWVDGRVTSGHQSGRAKRNRQVPDGHPIAVTTGDMIIGALQKAPQFLSAALPLRVFPPRFNVYSEGESFDTHIDNAMMMLPGAGGRMRTDLSATLFLSNPDEYEGGELTIEDTYGTHQVKLPAGHLILYPSSSLHYVRPVSKGARLAAFFWIQSMVREDGQRTLLYDMDTAIQRLLRDHPDHPSGVQFTGVYHNLLRQWMDV